MPAIAKGISIVIKTAMVRMLQYLKLILAEAHSIILVLKALRVMVILIAIMTATVLTRPISKPTLAEVPSGILVHQMGPLRLVAGPKEEATAIIGAMLPRAVALGRDPAPEGHLLSPKGELGSVTPLGLSEPDEATQQESDLHHR